MTQESSYHASAPLGIAVTLSAVAGFIDAHMYLNVTQVFVANMSGNMIQLGMSVGAGEWSDVATASTALLGFLFGVVGATVHHDRRVRRGLVVHPARLLAIEAVMVIEVAVLLVAFDVRISAVRPMTYLVVALGSIAMGLQTLALRRVGAVAVATTYGTGTIVRVGEKLALGARRADHAGEHRRRVTIVVLTAVLLGYVTGAAIAAALGASPWQLLIPAVVLVVAALLSRTPPEPAVSGSRTAG